jgi:tetratricopeptide (TPR) repeat protein
MELDPIRAPAYSNLADAYIRAGRLDEAEATLDRGLEVTPGYVFSQANLGMTYVLTDRPDQALALAEQIQVEPVKLIVQGLAYHTADQPDAADQTLAMMAEKYAGAIAFYIAMNHAWHENADAAFEWLERAVNEGQDVSGMRTDPFMQGLHGDPRWEPLLTRVGLSDAQVANIDF